MPDIEKRVQDLEQKLQGRGIITLQSNRLKVDISIALSKLATKLELNKAIIAIQSVDVSKFVKKGALASLSIFLQTFSLKVHALLDEEGNNLEDADGKILVIDNR